MKTKVVLIFFFISVGIEAHPRFKRSTQNEYKMCVPEDLLGLCQEMASQETKSTARIICISARDRLECIEKIQQRVADFGTVDPEDMYIASKIPNQDFGVFEEIRTHEEPDAEFRYEAVAVVHKDLDIHSVEGLKGLNSCHTGVGRNVGYKIPLTKLKQRGVIGPLNEDGLSARENELKAFSTLFNKACIVGKWSPDPKINLEWKTRYSNLCALCEHPKICDYPDNFSGYDGALRCLAHNGGQVAWTKVIYVKKFFGLPVGTAPAKPTSEKPEEYAYFCPDGTKVPITGTPCRWAARPWQGYMANADVIKTVDELRRKIENLDMVGLKNHAPWLEKILELDEKTVPRENKVIPPGDYLDKANYTDVIERDYGPPYKVIRICVTSKEELKKCNDLSLSAFSRNIRPRFGCIEEKTFVDCLRTIRDNGADIVTLNGDWVDRGEEFNLAPIVAERYQSGQSYYIVAVVKKTSETSNFDSLANLKNAKACFPGINGTGYNAVLYNLIEKNLIEKKKCANAMKEYFSQSCAPGADDSCQLCPKHSLDCDDIYSGNTGAFRCLVESGDVAFVDHLTLFENTDGKGDNWAKNLKSEDFQLLCPDGGRKKIEEYQNCHLLQAPSHMVVTSRSKSDAEIDEIRNLLISTSTQYSKRSDLFKLFGSYNGKKDLLFKDSTTGLVSVTGENELQKEYSKKLSVVHSCS